ncbi:DUF6343 family protein [Actinospica robiniae]|uniref:DUF6343 family protein n=1 Tax=Actinospica robiniae TaxID=304901 RepID=UPI0004247154|nr:DUF6343 family protein [Actinospica robiniae]
MEPRHHHEVREHRPRTGDEPMHARSALRMRLVLAFIGLANGLAGVGIFGFWLRVLPLAILFGVLAVIALGNIAVVIHRIRQGAHFQPGPEVPPYRPDREPSERAEPAEPPVPVSPARRRTRYLVMMGVCLLMLIVAWTWVRFYSVPAALIISVVAALVPPIAAVVANADSPILRENSGRDETGQERPETDEDRDRRPPAPD